MIHKKITTKAVTLFLSFLTHTTFAQEKLGISNSNYSSINSIFMNPSSSVDSRTFIQFNLIGLNAYIMNNQAYIPNFSVRSSVIKKNIDAPQMSTSTLNKFVYSKLDVLGPTLVVSNKEVGVGFFTRARAEVDVRNIPYELTKILTQQNIDPTQVSYDLNIRNAKISQMSWVEYGVNFGKMFRKRNDVIIAGGLNAKYLTGINFIYFNLERLKGHVDYFNVDIENLKGKLIYNNPPMWKAGKGFGTDIGFSYKKMLDWVDSYYSNSKLSNCKYVDYRYKFGLTLLDVGAIRYNQNVFKNEISASMNINDYKTTNLDSLYKANFNLSQQVNKTIWVSLPTALSAQMDWNLSYYLDWSLDRHLYINASMVQALTTARIVGVQRSNLISVTPRYERKNIELAMPVTLYRYIYPQVGLAFRYRTFVLGVDNVRPFIFKRNTYGLNIYFNLGFSIFKNPACNSGYRKIYLPKKFKDVISFKAFTKRKSVTNKGFRSKEQRTTKSIDKCPKFISPNKHDKKMLHKDK